MAPFDGPDDGYIGLIGIYVKRQNLAICHHRACPGHDAVGEIIPGLMHRRFFALAVSAKRRRLLFRPRASGSNLRQVIAKAAAAGWKRWQQRIRQRCSALALSNWYQHFGLAPAVLEWIRELVTAARRCGRYGFWGSNTPLPNRIADQRHCVTLSGPHTGGHDEILEDCCGMSCRGADRDSGHRLDCRCANYERHRSERARRRDDRNAGNRCPGGKYDTCVAAVVKAGWTTRGAATHCTRTCAK